ncbi:hypothetical protein [Methanobrevibacter sp.]|uniref:hypothetical protein n=1 Tax=Methanobrevibacter sp. TaxID=66852 RepID=UPI00389108BA
MDLLEQIRGTFPKTIDKSKPIFSAVVANSAGTGAIQKQVTDLLEYMKEWTSTPNIYEQTGDMLEKTTNFFSFLERFSDETDEGFKARISAIFIRNHDTKWGTPYDVKSVFRQYFPHATVYLIENTNKIDAVEVGLGNLFLDGDIDTDTPTDWTLTNCVARPEARFSKAYGIELNQNGATLSQQVDVNSSATYFLHFFLKGNVNVQIKDNHNKYWDYKTKTWKNSAVNNSFTTEDWDNCTLFFITNSNATKITVSFIYVDTLTYIDYFRLFAKQPYSSFTVIAHFDGNTAENAFGLAAGDDDPNTQTSVITATINSPTLSGNGTSVLPSDWDLKDCTMSSDSVDISDSLAMISKTINVSHSTIYNLSFSFTGKLSVLVKDNNGKYFDFGTSTWKEHFDSNIFSAESLTSKILTLTTSAETTELTIEIKLTPPQPRYSHYGYYDKSFLSGVPVGFANDIYDDLLDYLRSQGVRAYLDIIVRDYLE